MKLNKIKSIFCEEFKTFIDEFEVYKNPTKSEMKVFFKETMKTLKEKRLYGWSYNPSSGKYLIRFIIDIKNKDFYLFDSNLLHEKVMKEVFNKKNYHNGTSFFLGTGIYNIEDNFIEYEESFDWEETGDEELKELLKIDLSFLSKYLKNYEEIKKDVKDVLAWGI